MPRHRHSNEQIIGQLREAEDLFSQGKTVALAAKQLGVGLAAYYCSRKKYVGFKLDKAIPKKAASGKI